MPVLPAVVAWWSFLLTSQPAERRSFEHDSDRVWRSWSPHAHLSNIFALFGLTTDNGVGKPLFTWPPSQTAVQNLTRHHSRPLPSTHVQIGFRTGPVKFKTKSHQSSDSWPTLLAQLLYVDVLHDKTKRSLFWRDCHLRFVKTVHDWSLTSKEQT